MSRLILFLSTLTPFAAAAASCCGCGCTGCGCC